MHWAGGVLKMRRRWLEYVVTVVLACSIACDSAAPGRDAQSAGDATGEPRDHADAFEEERRTVERVLTSALTETPHRSVAVMLTDERGPRFHLFGARDANGASFDPDTTFEIGSVSKVFAGVLLADAERRGEVGLDDRIATHLPGWSLPTRDGRELTLRHAVTHFTGLPLMPSNWIETSGGTTHYTESMFRENLATHVLETAPGQKYTYGNLNTALIGLALTRRTGRSYATLLQERIFGPLGMSRSGYPDVRYRIDANMLDGYEADDSLSAPRIDVSPMGPCCVVRTTLRDMSRFAAAALAGSGPLAHVFTRVAQPERAIDPSDPDSRWIALGWEVDRRDGLWRKSGQVAGYRCELVLLPHQRRALFVLVNSMRAKVLRFSDGLVEALWAPRPTGAMAPFSQLRVERVPDAVSLVRAKFDDAIALEGWQAPARAEPSTSVEVELYWRSLRRIADDYRVFVHGDPPASGAERASGDHYLRAADNASLTTRDWPVGMLVRDRFRVKIPDAFPAGELTLWFGWYRGSQRLHAASEALEVDDDRVRGPSITIASPKF